MEQLLASVMNFLRWIASIIQSSFKKATSFFNYFGGIAGGGGGGPTITMDTGYEIRLGKKIAEGGFSFVFEAYDVNFNSQSQQKNNKRKNQHHHHHQLYAIKQIQCPESSMLNAVRQEASIHRAAGIMNHPNILPLLGFSVIQPQDNNNSSNKVAYMLFPRMHRSLRNEINHRILDAPGDIYNSNLSPWPVEVDVLNLFLGIARGLQALHSAHYSHRDCKVENVMFEHPGSIRTPILMDFGSVGPLREDIRTRRDVLNVFDRAAQHTTMPYRPPELFEGGVRPGDDPIDYTAVDVWSLGCTCFAVLYGASPSESEFSRSNNNGRLRIVDCSQLKVLSGIPKLPQHTPASNWYSKDTLKLIEQMLIQDRSKRPTLQNVITQLESLIQKKGGRVIELEEQNNNNNISNNNNFDHHNHHHHLGLIHHHDDNGDDDFHSLLSSNNSRGFP